MDAFLHFLREAPLPILALCFFAENGFIVAATLLVGAWLSRIFASRRVAEVAPPLTSIELALALLTLCLNSLVTFVGLLLWRRDIIHFRTGFGWTVLLDFPLLVIVMDVAMYVLHRLAHVPLLFQRIHRTHHFYDNPRPLTLFVMNPLEALSFGFLWLALLCVYDATWIGMSLYLVFNALFGLLGHVGVEPLPDRWKTSPILKHISTSSFHAGHHGDEQHNFGFYTLIWDRLFGTVSLDYEDDFGRCGS